MNTNFVQGFNRLGCV